MRSSRRKTVRSRMSTSLRASWRPNEAAKASRPIRPALGRPATTKLAARRGLPVSVKATPDTPSDATAARLAKCSSGPPGNGTGRSTWTKARGGFSAARVCSSSSRRSQPRRRSCDSRTRLARCPMSTTNPSGPWASAWTKAFDRPRPRSVAGAPRCCSKKPRRWGSVSTSAARPQSHDVGAEGDGVATERPEVTGMLGPLVGEALVTHLVSLFDRFDLVHEIVEGRTFRIEDHDHPTEHGVHLGPVHPFDRVQCRLEVLDQWVVTGSVHGADLDVCTTLAHPHPPGSAARGE